MGRAQTPQAFAKEYRPVKCMYRKITYVADVYRYLSKNTGAGDEKRLEGAQAAKAFILRDLENDDGVLREGQRYRVGEGADRAYVTASAIENAFQGTATPNELSQVLWLAAYQGHIVSEVKVKKPEVSTAQDFADWYLGMDCTGFVGAYFGAVRSIDWYLAKRPIAKEPIRMGHVMVRKEINGARKHIALVATAVFQPPNLMLHTAEATGAHPGRYMEGVVTDKKRTLRAKSEGVYENPERPGFEYYFFSFD